MDFVVELSKHLPQELVEKLIAHYSSIKNNYRLSRHENTELNGSKFSEVVFRILQHTLEGKYIALDKQITSFTIKCRDLEGLPSAGVDDSLRIHIPRTLILIVDIRNKRGVGHVSGIHNPNELDSILVKTNCDWVFAEICRIFLGLSIDETQAVIDNIIQIELPIIEKIDDVRRVLDVDKSYQEQILLLLYSEFPNFVSITNLLTWTEHSNKTVFNKILSTLHSNRKIEKRNDECKILTPGIIEVESKLIKN